ncbi:hypothetical protein [Lutispora thermophila]|jgi:hypothetical protein|uniref:Uncharacterized protein n=1 Tax=Lutispora thermophila DSM 19022 TaxID=1122184 RepID=A0A1M6IH89_9FIRM|nr:hypothetical protein [Lutispora thermophila]SHJ33799.1 hypothetical protein SAMN02745176_03258 [Lutispora thermophila DSM 19022]
MNQKSPLLKYRIECDCNETAELPNKSYDFVSGLWVDESGEPFIRKYIESSSLSGRTETLITKTREGIDRSERSRGIENNLSFADKTLITETKEGIDKSEKGYGYDENMQENKMNAFGETLITRTREGIDRAERSGSSDNLLFQTITTFTRESIDRSEKS